MTSVGPSDEDVEPEATAKPNEVSTNATIYEPRVEIIEGEAVQRDDGAQASCPATEAIEPGGAEYDEDENDEDVEEEEAEEQQQQQQPPTLDPVSNSLPTFYEYSSAVDDDVNKCRHALNVAIIALEDLRKVSLIIKLLRKCVTNW